MASTQLDLPLLQHDLRSMHEIAKTLKQQLLDPFHGSPFYKICVNAHLLVVTSHTSIAEYLSSQVVRDSVGTVNRSCSPFTSFRDLEAWLGCAHVLPVIQP